MSDLVSDLQDVAEGRLDLASIVAGASDSLKLIAAWYEASVDNDALMKIVKEIQQNSLIYYDALDMSIKTAEDGHAFSSDIVDLCDFLLDPTTDLKDILEYVETIRYKADIIHTESRATMEKFRAVRAGLFKITQRIPVEVEKLAKSEHGQKIDIVFKLSPFTRMTTDTAELKQREVECATVIVELQRVASDLEELSGNVDEFVRWWLVVKTLLLTEKGRGESLNPQKVEKLVIKSTQKGWRKIQADYLEYKANFIKLQNYYPPAPQRNLDFHSIDGFIYPIGRLPSDIDTASELSDNQVKEPAIAEEQRGTEGDNAATKEIRQARQDFADDCIFLPEDDAPTTSKQMAKGKSPARSRPIVQADLTQTKAKKPPRSQPSRNTKASAAADRTELYYHPLGPVDRSSRKKRDQADSSATRRCCIIQ